MIKILPLENKKCDVEPYFFMSIGIGYGEHCNDTTTESRIYIDDYKATGKHLDAEGYDENGFPDYTTYMTTKEAEETYKFFNEILDKRKDNDGYIVDHLVLNDGPSEFWHCENGGMTKKEFKWFKKFYDKWGSYLGPEIEHNWYGIVWVSIEYVDENGKEHRCEVV